MPLKTYQLPNTRFVLGVSYTYFTRPDPTNDPQDVLYPHVRVSRTWADLVNDVDPVMSHIVNAPECGSATREATAEEAWSWWAVQGSNLRHPA